VQTPMQGEPTFMKLDPKVSKYAMELFLDRKDVGDGWVLIHLDTQSDVWMRASKHFVVHDDKS
jgi:hypothetical protein